MRVLAVIALPFSMLTKCVRPYHVYVRTYTFCACYFMQAWVDMKKKHRFSQARNSELQWCKRNFLNKRILQEVSELVAELTKRLSFFNIKPSQSLNPR